MPNRARSFSVSRARRDAALLLAGFALPFAIYFTWRWQWFGFPLPNTYYAKA